MASSDPENQELIKCNQLAHAGIEFSLFTLSDAIFDFCDPSLGLTDVIQMHAENKAANPLGVVPEYFKMESRVGASLALLGYLRQSPKDNFVTVVCSSSAIQLMEPVLQQHLSTFKASKVAFQVAAVEYNPTKSSLESPVATVSRTARNLGLPLVNSSLAIDSDGFNSTYLVSVISKFLGPAIHVFDGIRCAYQSVYASSGNVPPELPKSGVNSILDAFEVTNKTLGTNMQPFEYTGPKEPKTVYVTLGVPGVFTRVSADVGVINVRLYSPFLSDEFLAALPTTAISVVVVGQTNDLYKDVNQALKLFYGFNAGPAVSSEILSTEAGMDAGLASGPETGFTAKVWDRDSSPIAGAAGIMTFLTPGGNAFLTYDNFLAGGVAVSDLRLNFQNQFWSIRNADVVLVNDAQILKSADVTFEAKVGGKLVIAATSTESLNKAVPAQIKLNAMAKQLEVYRVDYSLIDQQNSQGRTLTMAVQGLLWTLAGVDLDTATSRTVHANSFDTELIAATVNKIISTLIEKALVKLTDEELQSWKSAEISEKELNTHFATQAVPTSFLPTSEIMGPSRTTGTEEVGHLDVKKRLVFKEAFREAKKLRPETPAKTFVAKVKRNQRVTPAEYDRNIFQLELDISGTGMKYALGEALGVHAPNNTKLVREFLEFYQVDPEEVFGIDFGSEDGLRSFRTAFQLAREYLDLFGKAPKRFYESLAEFASDDSERAKLLLLASADGAAELKLRSEEEFQNYVDVLHEFKSARPSFGELLELVSPLKRREYSIASSQKVHPNEVHLLVVVVDWETKSGEKRFGQCSKYLSDLANGEELVVSVKPSVMKLPQDPKAPVIMAGLGTGLAPFKAFLEEKVHQRDSGLEIGPIYLFMGSRHQREEYLYGELFEAYKAAGVLTHIGAAFSRDQPEKIYIQHRIQQQKPELAEAFWAKKGNFYLCGPTWPVPDISAALTEIVVEGAKSDGVEVNEETIIEDLKEQERYILEVY